MNIADMTVSSYIPPLLIAEGHLEVCFLAKRNGGLDYSKPPKKSAVQESVQNPLPVSGFFFSPLWRQMFGYVGSFHSTKNRTRRASSGIFTGAVI